jgi:hypothetical protein
MGSTVRWNAGWISAQRFEDFPIRPDTLLAVVRQLRLLLKYTVGSKPSESERNGERPRLAESCRSAFGRGNAEADLHVGTRLDLLYSSCAVQGISTWWSRRRVLTRTAASLVYMVPSK